MRVDDDMNQSQLFTLTETPSSRKFDQSWRQKSTIAHISRKDATPLIKRHYLQKWPGVVVCSLGMFCDDWIAGIIVYALPPAATNVRYGVETWELARLWVDDIVPCNGESWFISQSIKHIRQHHCHVGMLVSYADPSAGHVGTIYKAANWISDGRTDEGRLTPRCDYQVGDKIYSRRSHVPDGVEYERVYRVSKHRFIYTLGHG